MPNVRLAYQFAFLEMIRRPLYWTLVSLGSFAILLPVERPEWEFLSMVVYLALIVGIAHAALKAGVGHPYHMKDLFPGWRKIGKCWLLLLLSLPFFLSILYIVTKVTGLTQAVFIGSIAECIFEVIFFRFAFAWFYILSADVGIRQGLQLSWDAISPAMAVVFLQAIALSHLLTLPGMIADFLLGLPSGMWGNLLAPVISSLAFAAIFQQVHRRDPAADINRGRE